MDALMKAERAASRAAHRTWETDQKSAIETMSWDDAVRHEDMYALLAVAYLLGVPPAGLADLTAARKWARLSNCCRARVDVIREERRVERERREGVA